MTSPCRAIRLSPAALFWTLTMGWACAGPDSSRQPGSDSDSGRASTTAAATSDGDPSPDTPLKSALDSLTAIADSTSDAKAEGVVENVTFATYKVADWSELVPARRSDFSTARVAILADPTLTPEQKTAKVRAMREAIADTVRTLRTAAFDAVRKLEGIANSATGRGKDVPAKCGPSSWPNMYVTRPWVRGAYTSANDGRAAGPWILAAGRAVTDIITADGEKICAIRLKQAGSGRKVAWTEGEFRIRPTAITTIVEREMTPIMAAITGTPL